jgi:hypothetical protein
VLDPAGGGGPGADEMTLAFGHVEVREDGAFVSVVDEVLAATPPYSVDRVVAEFAAACALRGITTVASDKYGGAWVPTVFAKHEIAVVPLDLSRSDLYLEALPLLTSGRVRLIDDPVMFAQLVGLERRTGTRKDSIDHGPRQHDDRINVALGVAVVAQSVAEAALAARTEMSASELRMLQSFSKQFGGFDPSEIGNGYVEVDPDGSTWDVLGP